ncbi:MAG: hypothetical protein NC095_11655 [Muribaculum sp.]|nr:hypothetical protein [Muribaculum sp.]
MKYVYNFLFIIMAIIACSCSETEELEGGVDNKASNKSQYSFSLEFPDYLKTRSSRLDLGYKILTHGYALTPKWVTLYFESIGVWDYGDDIFLKGRIVNKTKNKVTDFPDWKGLTLKQLYFEKETINFSLPDGYENDEIDLDFGLITEDSYQIKTNYIYFDIYKHSTYHFLCETNRFYWDFLKSQTEGIDYEFNDIFDITGQYNEVDNRLFIPSPSYSLYGNVKFLKDGEIINNNVTLQHMNAIVFIFTDEFTDYVYNILLDRDLKSTIKPAFFTFLDCKTDRKIADYFDNNYYFAYSIPILNMQTNQQIMCLGRAYRNSVHGNYMYTYNGLVNSVSNFEFSDNDDFDNHDANIILEKDNRYFIPVCQKTFCMPFGIPKTNSKNFENAKTVFDNDDVDKELKYLVVNYSYEPDTSNGYTSPLPSNMRAVIPVPSNGFLPGHLYIIKNKPGTKLFKEWDEENGTTRSGEEYICDESSYEIEDISMQ